MRAKVRENAKEGDQNSNSSPLIIGFFHPFCDAMGGGEKVLFQALKAIQQDQRFDNTKILVYSGATISDQELQSEVKERFGTQISL